MNENKTQTNSLARIGFLVDQIARLEAEKVAAVQTARDAGCSLRAIAEAAGTSYETVRRASGS